jgi:serine protease Do
MQEIENEPGLDGLKENRDLEIYGPQPGPEATRRSSRSVAWLAIGFIVFSLMGALVFIQVAYNRTTEHVPELPAPRPVASANLPSAAELSQSFREVARLVKPALVYIDVVERTGGQPRMNDFFGFPSPGVPRRQPGAGSGFLVSPDGYILTNNHVVENADRIEVTLSDSRKFRATIKGTDQNTDLAVIKIEASGLPIAILGDSDEVQQGDWVLALGSPFGLQQTVTAGIVSATGRELGGSQFSRFIQTDASINPGNSGGPLVNMQGQVIGINSMIFSPSGGNVGIGFAIAANTVREVFDQLVKSGKVTRGYLGVRIEELDAPKASMLGLEPNAGVLVGDVPDPDTPAGRAGIRSGDVITTFDGKPVKTPRELTNAVASMPVGSSVVVDFIRNGERQSVTVELAERPAETAARVVPPDEEERPDNDTTRLGVSAQTITPAEAERMKLKIASGALVLAVQPGSPAADADMRHGDVIHKIDQKEVKTVEDLAQAVSALRDGQEVAVQIERRGQMFFVNVRLD